MRERYCCPPRPRPLLLTTGHGGSIHADQQEPRCSIYLNLLRRAEQSHDAEADAAVHEADQYVLKIAPEPTKACAVLALCPL